MEFSQRFEDAVGVFPGPGISDHCPAVIKMIPSRERKSWFRFQSFWTQTVEFKQCLQENWKGGCSNLLQFMQSLKALKRALKVDMRHLNVDMNKRVDKARADLSEIQQQICNNPRDEALLEVELDRVRELRKLLKFQFIYNCQRARIGWAKEGDLNTQYFHNVVRGRRNANRISSVQLDCGRVTFDMEIIKEEFVSYFKNMFGEEESGLREVDESLFQDDGGKIRASDCFDLVRDVTYDEVGRVIKELPKCKAAGPDGFNAEFFKAAWNTNGRDLFRVISRFFQGCVYAIWGELLIHRLNPQSA